MNRESSPERDDSKTDANRNDLPPTKSIAESTANSGRTIGPYRLCQKIGTGGMGEVWLAEQRSPIVRQVAVKLIKSGLDSQTVVARFEAERQALGLMNHSSIARVFDGGETEDGKPYFVMEWVQGTAITRYCDQNKLTLEERLKLFRQVCSAVHHAHQKGIIHRDLKPSNILVTTAEGTPIPKVIDFGLAKALDHRSKLTDKTMYTEFGQIVGTIQYMSPEQADLESHDIDVRTDIYALGVILYELLTGSTPLTQDSIQKLAMLKILQSIREIDPPRPSDRISSMGGQSESISQHRKTDSKRLSHILRGDLDWIVMKALEKDRTRRYASANDFQEDVDRFLQDQPVEARPPTFAYLAAKLIRKHRGPVIATASILLMFAAGLVGTVWGWSEALRQKSEAVEAAAKARKSEANEQRARIEAEDNLARATKAEEDATAKVSQLERMTRFQAERLSSLDASEMTIQIRELLLQQHHASLDLTKADDVDEKRKMEEFVEQVDRLPLVDLSLQVLESQIFSPAIAAAENEYGDDPLFQAAIFDAVGKIGIEVGLRAVVEKPLLRALEIRTRLLGEGHPLTLQSIINLAYFRTEAGQPEESEKLLRPALDLQERLQRVKSPEYFSTLHSLALCRYLQGDSAAAMDMLQRAIDGRMECLGKEDEATLESQGGMALILEANGKVREAEDVARQVFETSSKVLGPSHSFTLNALNNLAGILDAQGKSGQSLEMMLQGLEICRKHYGMNRLATLVMMNSTSQCLQTANRLDEAVALSREALSAGEKVLGPRHPHIISSMVTLANALESQGLQDQAEAIYVEAIGRAKQSRDVSPSSLRTMRANLAYLYTTTSRSAKALPLQREIHAEALRDLGESHQSTLIATNNLALTLLDLGEVAESESLLRKACEIAESAMPDDHIAKKSLEASLGKALYMAEKWDEACVHLKVPVDSGNVKSVLTYLDAVHRSGQFDQVLLDAESLVARWKAVLSDNPSGLQSNLVALVFFLNRIERTDEASHWLSQIDVETPQDLPAWLIKRVDLQKSLVKAKSIPNAEQWQYLQQAMEALTLQREEMPDWMQKQVDRELEMAKDYLESLPTKP